jgi:outer membrane protein assembly factor BamB
VLRFSLKDTCTSFLDRGRTDEWDDVMRRSRLHPLSTLALVALLLGSSLIGVEEQSTPTLGAATVSNGWTVYHGDAQGSGLSTTYKSIKTSSPAWTSPLVDGELFGQPVVLGNNVYVATENNTVYALSSTSGHVVWKRHIARAVPASALPCGNIAPTVGITGTPVIDPTRNEIFVVADELINGRPHHRMVGLNATTGAIELNENADPPGSDPAALLQRTGLNLDEGRVIFGMGGNSGDCALYRGRVGSVAETGSTPRFFTVDAMSGDSQGAVWMGGAAPVVNTKGDVWVSVGNGSVNSADGAYDDSDSLLEISPHMHLLQFFAPTSWPQNNASDLDMSMEPVLLANNQVVLAGKSRIVYLLNAVHLGGIGSGEATLASGCGGDMNGGTAAVGSIVYMPCGVGLVAMRVLHSPAALRIVWHTSVGGGPPIVAAGLVWTIGQDGTLYGLNPTSGAVRVNVSVGAPANHFPTPSVGDGLLLVPSANRVVAFLAT